MAPSLPARRAPAPSPYYEDLRDELHRIRVATELIAQALGHLIPYLTGDAAEAEVRGDEPPAGP
jgi:hypothetical protein